MFPSYERSEGEGKAIFSVEVYLNKEIALLLFKARHTKTHHFFYTFFMVKI